MAQSQASQLEAVIERANECVLFLKKIQEVPLPRSINEAITEEWIIDKTVSELSHLVEYDLVERAGDRARVMTLGKAIQLIEDFEDLLLETQITSESSLAIERLHEFKEIGVFLWENKGYIADELWQLLKFFLKEAATLDLMAFRNLTKLKLQMLALAFTIVGGVAAVWLNAATVPFVSANIVDIFRLAGTKVKEARKLALPQRSTPRVWRRKVARI